MKRIFVLFTIISISLTANAQMFTNEIDNVTIGYSRGFDGTNDIWFSLGRFEMSYFFNAHKEYLPDTYSPYNSVLWYNRSISEFSGLKFGYKICNFFSAGLLCSHRTEEFDYANGYCSLHNENHSWINGYSCDDVDYGFGAYGKLSLPTKTMSPFIVFQIASNKNNYFGIGITFNFNIW